MASQPKAVPLGADYSPLRDRVRDEVRQRIIDGRYPPGTRIIERELAEELQVSRIPIREAFRTLESEGFVEVVPRRGVIVGRLSERDVEQLFDVREALEVLACRRAAEAVTKAELRRMRQLLDRCRKAIDAGNQAEVGRLNSGFHDQLIALARNDLLAGLLEPLQGRLHWLFRQNDDPETLLREHVELLDAIGSGDPDRAAEQALNHVRRNRALALRLLFGDESAEPPATG